MREVKLLRKDEGIDIIPVYTVKEFKQINDWFDEKDFKVRQKRGQKEKCYFYNKPICFDIETTQVNTKDKPFSFMYVWQMAINGVVVVGRTWESFKSTIVYLKQKMRINDNRHCIIWIHNFPYEFQFIKYRFPFDKIFAREKHKIIKGELGKQYTGFEFRCSYAMTNLSLEKWTSEETSCPYLKTKDDIDYTITRTKNTVLADTELGYCVKDVLCMHYCLLAKIQNEKKQEIFTIPMTSTGFVRRDAREYFGKDKDYRKVYKDLQLDAEQFIIYKKGFRGGDTHANAAWCGDIIEGVGSYDLGSSYPYRILTNKFPMSKPMTIKNPSIEQMNYLLTNNKLFIMDVTLKNVRFKGLSHFTYLPIAHCENIVHYSSDNGRVVNAELLRTTVLSNELDIIASNYDYEIVSIHNIVYHENSGLLPIKFREFTIMLYIAKTTLKGVKGKESEYAYKKALLNSLYGMLVTNPLNDIIEFDFDDKEWYKRVLEISEDNKDKIEEELTKFYRSRNNFMVYEWGVWITAYAREDLNKALTLLGNDAIYWDTDSIYFRDIAKNNVVFKKLNADKVSFISTLPYIADEVAPKTKKGIRKMIGLWDWNLDEDNCTFKTLGAKCYFYTDKNGGHLTVSGVNKNKAIPHIEKELGSVLNIYNGFVIDDEHSGRTSSFYCEDTTTETVDGVDCTEYSYMSIVPGTYTFGDTDEHREFIALMQNAKIKTR